MAQYFDDCADDSRTEFVFNKNRDGLVGLSLKEVEEGIKNKLEQMIINKFPQISEENIKIENECVDEYPHLKNILFLMKRLSKTKRILLKKQKNYMKMKKKKQKMIFLNC